MGGSTGGNLKRIILQEKVLFFNLFTLIIFLRFYGVLLAQPHHFFVMLLTFIWLLVVIFAGAFAVARHAGALAILLKEPLGTLILTISVVAIEVMMITSVMLTGAESPTLARDTMFAVIMIVLNGLLGLTLLVGGWRYREQQINLQGAKAFLSVIFLISIVGLILPNFTYSTPGPTLSPFLTVFMIIISLTIYGVFLGIQTVRHRKYFLEVAVEKRRAMERHGEVHYTMSMHVVLLIGYLLIIVFLAKIIAIPIDYATETLKAPHALSGILVALLVLAPEALTSLRATLHDLLQHSVNILLGSVLATIGLTIPAVETVGMITGKPVVLGLDSVDSTLLFLTLLMSILTFGSERTNVLQGVVHLLIFLIYLALIFD